jgi:H+/Cl- antiporter ClcA
MTPGQLAMQEEQEAQAKAETQPRSVLRWLGAALAAALAGAFLGALIAFLTSRDDSWLPVEVLGGAILGAFAGFWLCLLVVTFPRKNRLDSRPHQDRPER